MTFAAPLFLIAALAAAIPVLLHMINRQQAKSLPFPSLRFLKISAEKTRRRKRIHDLLLMLLRAAVLLLVALGLAKPTVTNLSALWGGADTAVAIILDNSASMGVIDSDRMRFDAAMAAITQIVDELRDGDQIAFLTTGGPDFPGLGKLDRTKQSIREILPQCKVSYERADLEAKIRQARQILAEAKTSNKQIYVLTDLQAPKDAASSNTSDAEASSKNVPTPVRGNEVGKDKRGNESVKEESDSIPIIFVDCNRKPKPNVAVQSVAVNTTTPVTDVPIAVSAEFYNASTVSWPCVAELFIDGAKQSVSPTLNLPPDGRAKHDFTFTCKSGGLHRGEIQLSGEDGSKFDDHRFFTVEVDQAIPVAIVKSRQQEIPYLDDSYYLERALSAGKSAGAIHAAFFTADNLLKEPLANFKAIFLVNLPALNGDAAERLKTYVENGGSLVWIAGDNVEPDAYNLMNEQSKGLLLPAPLLEVRVPKPGDNRDSWHINFLDKQFPAFSLLTEPASLYQSVLVHKHIKLSADVGQAANLPSIHPGQVGSLTHDRASILARLDDNEPLLIEKKSEFGRTFFLGTGVHVNWTNLPLRPIFLPLISRLVFELAQVEKSHRSILAGQPLEMQFAKVAEPLGVEVVPPSGEMVRLKTQAASGKTGQEFRYTDTHDVGVYLLRLLDAAKSTQIAYSANVDPTEADPAKLDRVTLEKLYAPAPLLFADPTDLTSTFKTLREGKSLWGLFLISVLVMLVFETFLSNLLSPKQKTDDIPSR